MSFGKTERQIGFTYAAYQGLWGVLGHSRITQRTLHKLENAGIETARIDT